MANGGSFSADMSAATPARQPRIADNGILIADANEPEGIQLATLLKIIRRRRRVFLATLAGVTIIGTGINVYQRVFQPVFQGAFTLLINDPISATSGGDSAGNEAVGIGAVALNRTRQDVPTLIEVLESPLVLDPVREKLNQQWPDRKPPRFNVSQDRGSRTSSAAGILDVTIQGVDRSMLKDALIVTQKAYLEWSLQQRRERLREAVRFLDEQAPELQAKASAIRGEVQAFRLKNRLLGPEEEAAATRTQIETLRNALINQEAELGRLQRLREEVSTGKLVTRNFTSGSNDSGGGSGSSGGTEVELTVPDQALLEELSKLDAQIAEARSRYTPESPILLQLESARNSLVPQLQAKQLDAIDAALSQYRSSIRTTQAQISQLEVRFSTQPGLLREYEALQQKLTIAEGSLESYLRAREQFQLEIAQNTTPWKVIAAPEILPDPVEPNLARGLIQGVLLGVLAGIGAALLRDRLDHVFHSPAEVRDDLDEVLLGHVPYISIFSGLRRDKRFILESLDSESQNGGITSYERFHYQEAFRNLATSLRFLSTDQPLRAIALTSSIPSEGKSLSVILLAKTLSELGQRVLLVDADLRKPQIHDRLGIDNLRGLSNLLTDEVSDWQSLLQDVQGHDNWQVITAGRRPPDPARLLSSRRMSELVQTITNSNKYDLVIYDTPPALGLADAALVAEHLDGLIILVSLARVDRSLPKEAIKRMRQAGAPILGIVTNERVSRSSSGAQDATSYNYTYGYGDDFSSAASVFAHYNNDEETQLDTQQDPGEKTGWQKYAPTGRNLKELSRKINRWLDGR